MSPLVVWVLALSLAGPVFAQTDCQPAKPDDSRVVDRGPIKTVVGPLAQFDPCHASVRLETPSFFAPKQGDKPPLVIIAHGGGGLGGYEKDFARLMNQNGYATLVFDAFEMNGLQARTDLLLYNMSNGGRQRMIFKATLGAFRWALKREDIDTNRIFIQGLSNGGAVAVNMAGLTDAPQIKGVIAEGAPSTGIGFPNAITKPLLMLYGLADNYGGLKADDYLYLRAMPCHMNDHYPLTPEGFTAQCSLKSNRDATSPSPQSWAQALQAQGQPVRLELIEGGGHGMLFASFRTSSRQLPRGRAFYATHGAGPAQQAQLKTTILDFLKNAPR